MKYTVEDKTAINSGGFKRLRILPVNCSKKFAEDATKLLAKALSLSNVKKSND